MAITHHQRVLPLVPDEYPHLPAWLDNLSIALLTRFERLGDLSDINNALEHQRRAISLAPNGHPDMPKWLNDLGYELRTRFERLGNLVDIEESIEHQQRAVSLAAAGNSNMPLWLNNLGYSLRKRFERLGNLSDIEQSIEHHQRAVSLTPDGHLSRPIWLDTLSVSLLRRFERLGNLADIDEAIVHQRGILLLARGGHPNMPLWLNNLGYSLRKRFDRLGNLSDIEQSIEYHQRAVSIAPDGYLSMPTWLDNLSASLMGRFARLGNPVDLDDAIEHQQRAISLAPGGHPDISIWLNNLGHSLRKRFERLGDLADIDKAIQHQQRALSLLPETHSSIPTWLDNLCASLLRRFEHLGNLADVDDAIQYQQRALSLAPDGHPDMSLWLNNLGYPLQRRFDRLGNIADIDKAIGYHQRALSLLPEEHPSMPGWLDNFSASLLRRFERLGDPADIDKAIEHQHRAAALSVVGRPHSIFRAALQWAEVCSKHRDGASLDAYRRAMELLPRLVWIGNTVEARYGDIQDVGSICAKAVATAITMKDYQSALEWIEEGRSIVWRQIMQLRAPVDDIASVNPILAAELKQVAHDLDHAGSRRPLVGTVELSNESSIERAARQHRRLAERWEVLLNQARQIPGLAGFLRPRQASELMRSAHSSTVVMLNLHEGRCDALIIRPNVAVISHVPLAQFSYKKATEISAQMSQLLLRLNLINRGFKPMSHATKANFEPTLAILWTDLVKPVLDFLGYTTVRYNETVKSHLPRITWCTAGPLSFLPIHAAGDYSSKSMIFDYVVSSYTPTLSALLPSSSSSKAFSGILAVAQTSTPGMDPLPGTIAELDRIQERFRGLPATRLDGTEATSNVVLTAMKESSWVHLACHAKQDLNDPTKSGFFLHDGMLDLATITGKQLHDAELAFLSACQTATGDKALSDESVHLAAGMLTAGFRTVIATMWSIGDVDAPLVAERVYEHLLEGGVPDARRAAVAVHEATKCLREKVGVKEIAKWAPYIHIGQ
ncbi:hypothetical protein BDV93DRAFT_448075 [Ceratobasidium sp. AG-I]|nr:hypothetical protein BDV93DRAFT_448075 [Ceratobasidium sp. AG-I]